MTHLAQITPFPRRDRSAAKPIERLSLGTRVTVDIAPQLEMLVDGTICGRSLMRQQRYDVDIDLDGMRLTNIPAARVKRYEP